jgi:hypothetical protein
MKRWLTIIILIGISHAQELKRPTAQTTALSTTLGCSVGSSTGVSMPNAYDAGGLATQSTISSTAFYKSSRSNTAVFTSWQAAGGTYTALTLNINAYSPGYLSTVIGSGEGGACINYSTDSGATWNVVTCDIGDGWLQQTFSYSLSPTQNLANLRVGICTSGSALDSPGSEVGDSISVYDVWTSGTTTGGSGGVGTGSSSGSPHRGVVIAN